MLLAVGMITSLAACGNEGRINNSDSEDTSKSTMESTQTDKSKNSTDRNRVGIWRYRYDRGA